MAITGAQPAITPARSGLLRSGAGRSGWPILVGKKAWLYALSNIARSGATRSNYHSSRAFINIGGIWSGAEDSAARVLLESLTVTDRLDHEPATAAFRVQSPISVPPVGQSIVVTLGSQNTLQRLFAGQILSTSLTHVTSDRRHTVTDVQAIDWTYRLNHRRFSRRWTNRSATTIAQEIVAVGAPGYSAAYVAAGLPTLDEFTVTDQDTGGALTALVHRIGGYWYVDYFKTVHLFVDGDPYPATDPTVLNPVHPTLADLVIDTDGSQLVTRAFVEGGGSVAQTEVAPGETLLPVVTAAWYEAAGGVVKAGPQRLTYTGRHLGGGGSLVGPGAAPAAAPIALATAGLGIETGAHDYAIVFVTAGGVSLPGPRASVVVGAVSAPPAPPQIGATHAGAGPEPGYHEWGVTFVTPDGETVLGPRIGLIIPAGAQPLAAPAPATPTFGGAIEPGSFEYAMTFQTASGESTPGPLSSLVTLTAAAAAPQPATAPTPGTPTATGGNVDYLNYTYVTTFETALGEGSNGPQSAIVTPPLPPPVAAPATAPTFSAYIGGSAQIGGTLTWVVTFLTANGGETTAGLLSAPTTSGSGITGGVRLANVPTGGPTVTGRRVYRAKQPGTDTLHPAGHPLALAGTLSNNTATTFDDTIGVLGAAPPATNTSQGPSTATIPLSNIPIGPAGVIARSVYRSVVPGGAYQRVVRLANNSATTFTDTLATAALGPVLGAGATATQNAIPLALPLAPSGQGVTSRHIYRSKQGGPLQKLATFANNTTTSYTDTTPTASLGAAPPTISRTGAAEVDLRAIPTGGPDVTARRVYRTASPDVTAFGLVLTLADNVTTTATDTVRDDARGAAPPTVTTASANRVQLSAIQIGPSGTTARRLYRTAANASGLQLLTTLAENTSTSYLDAAADATLGAIAPTDDTSGLTQPAGIVRAGAATLPVAGAGGFPPAGWAVIGNGQQVIRYSGLIGSTLTGIPASGPGAVTATIAYNSTVTASPMLIGLPASGAGAILYAIRRGDDINLWIQVDDLNAQALVAALFTSSISGPHDGIIEDVIQDRRLSATEARARGRAHLQQRRTTEIRVRYRSRDLNSRAGRTVTVTLLGPPYYLSAQFVIQTVTIGDFTLTPPVCTVEASSTRFSFEDLLRRLSAAPVDT